MGTQLAFILSSIVLPPFCFILTGSLGVVLWGRWPRLGRTLTGVSLVFLWTVSTSAFNLPFLEMLGWPKPVDMQPGNGAQAIVVLGGGIARHAPEYGGADTVNTGTLDRLRYAAWLHRQTGLPVLATGGVVGRDAVAEGDLMKSVLEKEFSTPVKWVETKSQTTFENARNSAPILKEAGIGRVYVVTTAAHMHRAMQAFAPTGIEVLPAAIDIYTREPLTYQHFLPNPVAFQTGYLVAHELVGRVWYAVRQAFE